MNIKIKRARSVINTSMSMGRGFVAWTGGKDSTVILHLIKSWLGEIPFHVFWNNTGDIFDKQYWFIKNMEAAWNLRMIPVTESDKVKAINKIVKDFDLDFLMSGIRADEHPARADEKHFSKREDHVRVHPILDWTEEDVWNYIKANHVPYCSLYDEGYRSLGEKSKTKKAKGKEERSGREQKKEEAMKQLREMGYW